MKIPARAPPTALQSIPFGTLLMAGSGKGTGDD
jgi:hypothetical protein